MASESKTRADFTEPKLAQCLDKDSEDLEILANLPVVKHSSSQHFPEDDLAAWATAFGS